MEMTQTDRLIIRQAGSQTSRQTGCMHGKTDKLGKEGLHGDRQTGRQTDRQDMCLAELTCLVRRVCTEDKSRPKSSDLTCVSLSAAGGKKK